MTKKLLLLLLFPLCTFISFSSTACYITKDITREILLQGEFNESQKERSLIIPIKVTLTGNSILKLQFYCSVSNFTISILKEGEIVEQRLLSVSQLQIEIFDLSSLDSGGYSLTLSTPLGTLIHGELVLE